MQRSVTVASSGFAAGAGTEPWWCLETYCMLYRTLFSHPAPHSVLGSVAQKALRGTARYEVSKEEATVSTKQRSEGKGRATKGNEEEGGRKGRASGQA